MFIEFVVVAKVKLLIYRIGEDAEMIEIEKKQVSTYEVVTKKPTDILQVHVPIDSKNSAFQV